MQFPLRYPLQHTALNNPLQHTALNHPLQHSITHCSTQHSITHCMQHMDSKLPEYRVMLTPLQRSAAALCQVSPSQTAICRHLSQQQTISSRQSLDSQQQTISRQLLAAVARRASTRTKSCCEARLYRLLCHIRLLCCAPHVQPRLNRIAPPGDSSSRGAEAPDMSS